MGQEQHDRGQQGRAQQGERDREIDPREPVALAVAQQVEVERDQREGRQDAERGPDEEVVREVAVPRQRHHRRGDERGGEVEQCEAPHRAHRARMGDQVLAHAAPGPAGVEHQPGR